MGFKGDSKMNYPEFDVVKKCPKCGGQMYYYEMPLEDDALYLCFTCDDCDHEVYSYSDEEMQKIFNELEGWEGDL